MKKLNLYTVSGWTLVSGAKIGGVICFGSLVGCEEVYEKCQDDIVELVGIDLIKSKNN